MNGKVLSITLPLLGLLIWFFHRETGLEALSRFDTIEELHAAEAHTGYENGQPLEQLKIITFEGEKLTVLEGILKNLKIRRETIFNRVNKEVQSEYHLTLMTDEKNYDLTIDNTSRIIVHADRTYRIQSDALVRFLQERFNSEDVYIYP